MLNLLWTVPGAMAAYAVYQAIAPVAVKLADVLAVLPS